MEATPITVSQLNRDVQRLLDETLPPIWVEGEVSNFVCPSSGHWYFSLKDESAQVRCAMFRNSNRQLDFFPDNGQHILVHGKVGLYAPRGDYQFIVDFMEAAGDGLLKRKFELLKKQLSQEGLFALEHKLPIPKLPQCIGVITSPTGAAIHDILRVLKRRFASIPVIIYPTQVQGDEAPTQIVDAIETANRRNECDVLLLARGGGSLEDLWSFNNEAVARAIFASELAIVSGVGHEVDVTIADFIADYRAATPSAAAEVVSPDSMEWQKNFANFESRLRYLITNQLQQLIMTANQLQKRLKHPRQQLIEQSQKLDLIEQRLKQAWQYFIQHKQQQIHQFASCLIAHNPQQQINQLQTEHQFLQQRLNNSIKLILKQTKQQLQSTSRSLNNISPLATLERGYAIVTDQQQHVINDSKQVSKGDKIKNRLAQGELLCLVEDISS